MDGQMDGQTDVLCETVIPHHYYVAGIKMGDNLLKKKIYSQRANSFNSV